MTKLRISSLLLIVCLLMACRQRVTRTSHYDDSTVTVAAPAAQRDSTGLTSQADTLPATPRYTKRHYSAKELNKIIEIMERRFMAKCPANDVMVGFGLGENDITVDLIFDSPRNREKVRKYLMDGPFIKFDGPTKPRPVHRLAVTDTMGIRLKTEQEVYPHDVRTIRVKVINGSNTQITCGAEHDLAFMDARGTWRALPMRRAWIDVAYGILPGETFFSTAYLSPEAFPTPSGRYRYYFPHIHQRPAGMAHDRI